MSSYTSLRPHPTEPYPAHLALLVVFTVPSRTELNQIRYTDWAEYVRVWTIVLLTGHLMCLVERAHIVTDHTAAPLTRRAPAPLPAR